MQQSQKWQFAITDYYTIFGSDILHAQPIIKYWLIYKSKIDYWGYILIYLQKKIWYKLYKTFQKVSVCSHWL